MAEVVPFPHRGHLAPRICWVCAIVWLIVAPLSAILGWYGVWRAVAGLLGLR